MPALALPATSKKNLQLFIMFAGMIVFLVVSASLAYLWAQQHYQTQGLELLSGLRLDLSKQDKQAQVVVTSKIPTYTAHLGQKSDLSNILIRENFLGKNLFFDYGGNVNNPVLGVGETTSPAAVERLVIELTDIPQEFNRWSYTDPNKNPLTSAGLHVLNNDTVLIKIHMGPDVFAQEKESGGLSIRASWALMETIKEVVIANNKNDFTYINKTRDHDQFLEQMFKDLNARNDVEYFPIVVKRGLL